MNTTKILHKSATEVTRNHQQQLDRAELRLAMEEQFSQEEIIEMEEAKDSFLKELRLADEPTEPHHHGSGFGLRLAELLG